MTTQSIVKYFRGKLGEQIVKMFVCCLCSQRTWKHNRKKDFLYRLSIETIERLMKDQAYNETQLNKY